MEQENLFEEGEEIIREVRKHIIVYFSDFVLHTVACIVFIIGAHYVEEFGGLFATYGAELLVLVVLISFVSFFYSWTGNYFDVWHITNRHVVAVNQKDILSREVSFMEYSRIQDVLFEKNGLLQVWFGYGTLRIQTAGTDQEFFFNDVADVESVAHTLMGLRDNVKTTQV